MRERRALTVDVDVSSLEGVHSGTSIHRVLVLVDLEDLVHVVRAIAIATEVVEIEPVSPTALAGDHADALDAATGERAARQDLERAGSQVHVRAVKLLLLLRHEEVDDLDTAVLLHRHVDGRLLQRRRGLEALDGNGSQLRRVAVAGREEDGSSVIRGETAARHPDGRALLRDGHVGALSREALDELARDLVDADQPSREVVLHTVRAESDVDELADVEKSRALVEDATVEDSLR